MMWYSIKHKDSFTLPYCTLPIYIEHALTPNLILFWLEFNFPLKFLQVLLLVHVSI